MIVIDTSREAVNGKTARKHDMACGRFCVYSGLQMDVTRD